MKIGLIPSRSTKHGLNLFIISLLVLGIFFLIEIISTRHNYQFDLTKIKKHSLSPQSIQIVNSLKKKVLISAFYRTDQEERRGAKNLLNRYAALSPKLNYRIVDPDRNLKEMQKYGIERYGTLVIECGKRKVIEEVVTEENITNGILKVTRGKPKIIYFLKGHGENEIVSSDNFHSEKSPRSYTKAKNALENENYEAKELLLIKESKIPNDAALLVISGPQKDFQREELEMIAKFVEGGGGALFLLDPYTVPSLVSFLARYELILKDDIVIDRSGIIFGGDDLMPIVAEYGEHPITKDLKLPTIFPLVRSAKANIVFEQKINNQSLLNTRPESWAESDKKSIEKGEAIFQENQDKRGPIAIAALTAIKGEGKEGRIVVFGDSDFANNTYISLYGNKDLFLNTISWLAAEESLISVRHKDKKYEYGILTAKQERIIFWLPVVAQPALVLLIGVIIFICRRSEGWSLKRLLFWR